MFFNLLVVAGSETTRNSIALGMVALIEHPEQLEALRDDRSLMPSAVEEILRWTSATLYNRRSVTATPSWAVTRSREGDKVTLWWPSANRDESVFEDPFRFDIRRSPNSHLAFGHRDPLLRGRQSGPHGDSGDPRRGPRPAGGLRIDRSGRAGPDQQARRGAGASRCASTRRQPTAPALTAEPA